MEASVKGIGSSTARAAEAGTTEAAPRAPAGMAGGEVALSEGAEGACGVVFRGLDTRRGASLVGGDDGRRLPLHFLVEDVLGLRLR